MTSRTLLSFYLDFATIGKNLTVDIQKMIVLFLIFNNTPSPRQHLSIKFNFITYKKNKNKNTFISE